MLDKIISNTKGNINERFKIIKRIAEDEMKKSPLSPSYGFPTIFLFKLGNDIYVGRRDSNHILDSDKEIGNILSFYVDYGIYNQIKNIEEEKIVNCPLKNNKQYPYCENCDGKIKITIEKNKIIYEPIGLNEKCPIIKEWIGEKELLE
jgi:hypothetical protein